MTEKHKVRDAARAVVAHYNADVYFYSAEINDKGFGKLVSAVSDNKRNDNALLIMVTNGGSADSAYKIARFFQKSYSNGQFILFAPSYCKSAGTLVALGANKLLMDVISELSPLDVQLLKQDEIGTRKSGLLAKSSFDALQDASFGLFEHFMLQIKRKSGDLISFKLAAEVSSGLASGMMSGVYAQISPDVVSSEYRDLQVALHYGIRLVGYSKNAPPTTVKHLVEHYPSHDFVIDDEEASVLFHDVETPAGSLYDLVGLLGDAAYDEDSSGVVMPIEGDEKDVGEKSDADHDATEASGGPAQDREPHGLDEDREEDRRGDPEASGEPGAGSTSPALSP